MGWYQRRVHGGRLNANGIKRQVRFVCIVTEACACGTIHTNLTCLLIPLAFSRPECNKLICFSFMNNIFRAQNVLSFFYQNKDVFVENENCMIFWQLVTRQKNVQVLIELMHSNLGRISDFSQRPHSMKLISTTSLV